MTPQKKPSPCANVNLEKSQSISTVEESQESPENNPLQECEFLRKRLQEERDKLLTIINASTCEVWFTNAEGNLVLANKAAANAFGVKKPEELYQPVSELMSKLDRFDFEGMEKSSEDIPLLKSLQGEVIKDSIEIIRNPQTGLLSCREINSVPVCDETGQLIGALAVARDITELRRNERRLEKRTRELFDTKRALERQNELLQTIIDNIPVMLTLHDPGGKFRLVNREFQRLIGLSIEDIQTVYQLPGCHDGQDFSATYLEFLKPTISEWKDFSIKTKNGSCLETSWAHVVLSDGRQIGIGIDITERKKVEQEVRKLNEELEERVVQRTEELQASNEKLKTALETLRESEEKYSTMLDQAKDGIYIIQDEEFRFANPALAEMLGYSRQEMSDKYIYDIIAPESKALVKYRHRKRLTGAKVETTYEIKALRKDGSKKDVELSVAVFPYKGRPGVVGIMRDITERKRLEEALLRAQRLDAVGLLAGGIAHEFNNILTGIMGNISLARLNLKSEETNTFLERAEEASLRARDLATKLLTFAKGGWPIKKITSISGLLLEAGHLGVSGSEVRCEFFLPDDLWKVEIDENQMFQAISNLVINAKQAMPRGGLIAIRAENVVVTSDDHLPISEGRYVKLMIEDHGIGISKEDLDKIFDIYFTTREGSRGLGLAITHSIIKKHEGHIEIKSEVNKGTVVTVYLPAAKD